MVGHRATPTTRPYGGCPSDLSAGSVIAVSTECGTQDGGQLSVRKARGPYPCLRGRTANAGHSESGDSSGMPAPLARSAAELGCVGGDVLARCSPVGALGALERDRQGGVQVDHVASTFAKALRPVRRSLGAAASRLAARAFAVLSGRRAVDLVRRGRQKSSRCCLSKPTRSHSSPLPPAPLPRRRLGCIVSRVGSDPSWAAQTDAVASFIPRAASATGATSSGSSVSRCSEVVAFVVASVVPPICCRSKGSSR